MRLGSEPEARTDSWQPDHRFATRYRLPKPRQVQHATFSLIRQRALRSAMAERKGMLRLWFTVASWITPMAPVVATTPVLSASEFSAGVSSASATAHDLSRASLAHSAGYSNFGYESVYTHLYWGQDSGHNCTNYVAYRFSAAGVGKPAWIGIGDAEMWGIWAGSITNSTPGVGAIAWWGASSLLRHLRRPCLHRAGSWQWRELHRLR